MSQTLTTNPFGHATEKWIQDYMYPANKSTTKAPAGMLIPQQRAGDSSLHTYLCGNGLFEVIGTYDYENNKIIKTAIHFHVPFFGRLLFAQDVTRVLYSRIDIPVPADCAPVTGKVSILPQGGVKDHPNAIGLAFDLITPGYDNLSHPGLPLFPVDSVSLQANHWYKDVPLMEESHVSALRAIMESPVKSGNPKVGYEHVVLAVDRAQNDEQKSLLKAFFDTFASSNDKDKQGKILIPATPKFLGAPNRDGEAATKQRTVRVRFLNLFQLNGTINTETYYINAILSIFIPVARSTHTCQIRGNLADVAGVVVVVDEPMMHGLVNLDCDPTTPGKTVNITLKMSVSLIGNIKEENYPLLNLA
ncbi:hypothetical protein RSOLAG1IB_06766 [Rhizoctonia solani AG-1 IB]|uniref:Uncharacterized protein n=1 Tax=Thanatephorus cucumeris (strain AG1-IB / isolate 7/3/14) TaxID=1108050 RepID=A0A0B7FCZ5_THACB|nr:hypothetical protein RSOLAG1IB_06766 [Rhizoctonia solani AG-1 IB]